MLKACEVIKKGKITQTPSLNQYFHFAVNLSCFPPPMALCACARARVCVCVCVCVATVKRNLESESESEVAQSCPTLCDPMGCSLPGSSVHGILEFTAIQNFLLLFSYDILF